MSGIHLTDKNWNNSGKIYNLQYAVLQTIQYHGRFEAAKRNTKSSDRAKPSICTKSSVFIRLLPSCSLLQIHNQKEDMTSTRDAPLLGMHSKIYLTRSLILAPHLEIHSIDWNSWNKLEQVQSNSYLSVLLKEDLKWSKHVASASGRVNKVLAMIKRNFWNCPKKR